MIQLAVILESIQSRADKSIKLSFGTLELTPSQVGSLFQFHQKACHIAVNENVFSSAEISDLKNVKAEWMDSGKSPSERLRGVLFVNWKNEPQGYEEFEDYYIHQMNKITSHYKSKLP